MIPSYVDIVVQLDPSRAVEFDFFERLPDNIVGLTLGLLRRLDDGGFVQVALVVDIQLAERVGQREDFILLELRIFSRGPSVLRVTCCVYMRKKVCLRQLFSYFWSLRTFMFAIVRAPTAPKGF